MRLNVITIAALACAGSALGQQATITTGAYSSGNGGEFNITLSGGPAVSALTGAGYYESFCLERSEQFSPGGTYNFTIQTYAAGGGGGAIGGQDPLDDRTAYIYDLFITGSLAGYDYANAGGLRQQHAGALQNVIWYLEDEVGSLDSAEAVNWYTLAQAGAGQGLGNVGVLHLYSLDASGAEVPAQDQLVRVPAPASLSMFGLAIVAGRRRRR